MKNIVLIFSLFLSLTIQAATPLPFIPYWETITSSGFENPNNIEVTAVAEFKGAHFAATYNEKAGAQIYRATAQDYYYSWTKVAQLPANHPGIHTMTVHNGMLLAGTRSYTVRPPMQYPAAIFATRDGLRWSAIMRGGLGSTRNAVVRSFLVDHPYLYAGTSHSYSSKIYRSLDAQDWEEVEQRGFGIPYNTHTNSIIRHKDALFASGSAGVIARSPDGSPKTWRVYSKNFNRPEGDAVDNDTSRVRTSSIGALASYKGFLVAAALDRKRGAAVWVQREGLNSNQWTLASSFGMSDSSFHTSIHTMMVEEHPTDSNDQVLIVGTWSTTGASLFITSDDTPPFRWTEIGAGGFGYYSMASHVRDIKRLGDYLYIAISGKGSFSNSPGKLLRIILWDL